MAAAAWKSLKGAQSYDRNGVFREEIDARLAAISGKAAMQFVLQGAWTDALVAVRVAEGAGQGDSAKIVRSKLDDRAGELYAEAMREKDGSPKEARRKLTEITVLVPASNAWYGKAKRALATL